MTCNILPDTGRTDGDVNPHKSSETFFYIIHIRANSGEYIKIPFSLYDRTF